MITILMPCLNEEKTIATCIHKAKNFLSENNINGEILIADNGSTDNSIQIAAQCGANIINVSQKGYGSALTAGIKAAKFENIIMGDADDSYDFSNLKPFIDKLDQNYDLVMGNRFKGGIDNGAMPFLHRFIGNPILTFIGKILFTSKANDYHCGLRGFKKTSMIRINLTTTGMEFATEMLIKAHLNKLKITEVPTRLKKDGRNRPPHLKTWRDGWRHLKYMLIYRPTVIFLYPSIITILIGITLSSITYVESYKILGKNLGMNTFITGLCVLQIGIQTIILYFLTKYFIIKNDLQIEKNINKLRINLYQNFYNIFTITSLIILTIGIYIFYSQYNYWQMSGYGQLNELITKKIIISVMLLITSIQMFFVSFFIGMIEHET